MSEKSIKYYVYPRDNSNHVLNNAEPLGIDTITFEDLERNKNCIDWNYLCSYILEESCTKDFYDTFNDHLLWSSTNFIKYVDEKDFYEKNRFDLIRNDYLFRLKPDLSEKFCRDYLNYVKNKSVNSSINAFAFVFAGGNNYNTKMTMRSILLYNQCLSSNFIEDVFKAIRNKIKTENFEKISYGSIYTYRDTLGYIINEQFLTEDQAYSLLGGKAELNELFNKVFTKFDRFKILVNPKSNLSLDFIKNNRKDLNTKAFFSTEQVKDYLAKHVISDNAIEVFKTKIDYESLLMCTLTDDIINSLVRNCKTQLFSALLNPPKHANQETINKLLKLIG